MECISLRTNPNYHFGFLYAKETDMLGVSTAGCTDTFHILYEVVM